MPEFTIFRKFTFIPVFPFSVKSRGLIILLLVLSFLVLPFSGIC